MLILWVNLVLKLVETFHMSSCLYTTRKEIVGSFYDWLLTNAKWKYLNLIFICGKFCMLIILWGKEIRKSFFFTFI